MCKFLSDIFKPKEPEVIGTTDPTGTTPDNPNDVIGIVDGEEDPIEVIEDNNDEQEEPVMDVARMELEKKILDYAIKMSEGSVRKISEIAVHCTATKEGQDVTIEQIDAWHKARGFTKQKKSGHYCGYHFVVALDGTIMEGRYLCETGAHVKDHNSKSIGVCYVGGLDANGKAKDTRTDAQKESLIWLIGQLKEKLNITKVQGHRDYSPDTNGNGIIESFEWIKACPCFNAIPEYKDI